MSKKQLNSKSIARIAAIQALYQYSNYEENNVQKSINQIIDFYKSKDINKDYEIADKDNIKVKPSYNYMKDIVTLTSENITDIDDIISKYLSKDFTVEKLPKLLLAILRAGVCEITYFPETPKKIILNEYTDIASDMIAENEVGFVNSLLDKYSKIR